MKVESIKDIEKDCLKLQKHGFLTEFGKGEFHIIEIYNKEKEKIWNILNTTQS